MNGCLSDTMPVVLKVIAKPTFIIGDDITKCIYDTVETIQASNFSPAMNADSYVNWTISSTNSVNKSPSSISLASRLISLKCL